MIQQQPFSAFCVPVRERVAVREGVIVKVCTIVLLLALLPGCTWFSAIGNSKDLAGRKNEVVNFQARLVQVAGQHPTGMLNVDGPAIAQYETYVTLADDASEVVLVSRQPVNCERYVQVRGVVRLISLYGDTGTKNEYSRLWVEVQSFSCLPGQGLGQ